MLMTTPVSEAESERRLRPVVDALFAHNSKQGLKLVQQALQKRPGWPAARALRACIFLQTERRIDAEQEISSLRSDLDHGRVPVDEDAAKKLHMYYQEIRSESSSGEVYEEAWKADFPNVRLAELAYAYYLRGNAFSGAQKVATKLHRYASSKTQKYGLWATVALWLGLVYMSRDSSESDISSDDRMLKLACAMMKKALDASPTPTAEIVRFACRVYQDAGQYQNAYDLVSNRRLVIDDAEVLQIRASIPLEREKQRTDYREMLSKHDSDDWEHWIKYFELSEGDPTWTTEMFEFTDSIISKEKNGRDAKRGPHLARLELLLRGKKHSELSPAIINYFDSFGAKPSCAHDLRPYIASLKGSKFFTVAFNGILSLVNELGFSHHLTFSWLRLWFGELSDSVGDLVGRYSGVLSEKIEATERQEGDDYLILAVHRLLPQTETVAHDRYANSSKVVQSIVLLEFGLSHSPFNHHLKLLLMRLYVEVGAMERAAELWDSLEVKHIQLATLSYMVLQPLFETGHHDALRTILEDIDGLWRECEREIPECISKSFQAGSINAAVEFVLFKLRLERSAILAEAVVIETFLEIVASGGEPLGIRRAQNCLTITSRFTPRTVASKRLIANDDFECLRFWDTADYDPESRFRGSSDNAEEGSVCTSPRKATISADMKSLEEMLALSIQNASEHVSHNEVAEVVASNGGRTNGANKHVHSLSQLRMDIADNLEDVKLVLTRCVSGNFKSFDDTENTSGIQDVLQMAKALTLRMKEEVEKAIAVSSEEEVTKGVMSPKQLRRCCRVAFDTLLLTSVAISSFSGDLVRGQRRIRKAMHKGDDDSKSKGITEFENVRQVILEYRDGILSGCSHIQEWITSCLDDGYDWVDSLFDDEQGLELSVPYLPDRIRPVNLDDGRPREGGDVSRYEFCSEVMEGIRSSHSVTCSKLLETLQATTRRLKLADF